MSQIGTFEKMYYSSIFEGSKRFNPDVLVSKYQDIEKDSDRIMKLKSKFAYDPENNLPSITGSIFFGDDEEEERRKVHFYPNKIRVKLNSKIKQKRKRQWKADMPDITAQRQLIESFKLKYDRSTPYEMGTRDYIGNMIEKRGNKQQSKGWVEYDSTKVKRRIFGNKEANNQNYIPDKLHLDVINEFEGEECTRLINISNKINLEDEIQNTTELDASAQSQKESSNEESSDSNSDGDSSD